MPPGFIIPVHKRLSKLLAFVPKDPGSNPVVSGFCLCYFSAQTALVLVKSLGSRHRPWLKQPESLFRNHFKWDNYEHWFTLERPWYKKNTVENDVKHHVQARMHVSSKHCGSVFAWHGLKFTRTLFLHDKNYFITHYSSVYPQQSMRHASFVFHRWAKSMWKSSQLPWKIVVWSTGVITPGNAWVGELAAVI